MTVTINGSTGITTNDGSVFTDGAGNVIINGSVTTGAPSVISVNSTSTALRITQTGAGNALVVEDSANPDATPFVVDAAGRVVVGDTTTFGQIGSTASVFNVSETGTQGNAVFGKFRASSSDAAIAFIKSRAATSGVNTAVISGDGLGLIRFAGADGTAYIEAASIQALVDGTPGTNDMPGRLVFSTTADGASSPTEAMRIDSAQRVGIGGAPTVGASFDVVKNITGVVNPIAIYSRGVIQSDATGDTSGFYSRLGTQAAAFTVDNIRHFRAFQGTFGAGSAVTNQFGFFVDSTLIGATNNYGFYSNIASGTGRWNFYANGTASNYFAGDVLVGSTGSYGISGFTANNIQSNSNNPNAGFSSSYWVAGPGGTDIQLMKSRGASVGTRAIVSSNDTLAQIVFAGDDGTNFIHAASVVASVDNTPGTNDMPGRLVFSTTADGASSPTERMRIHSSPLVEVKGASGVTDVATLRISDIYGAYADSTQAALEFYSADASTPAGASVRAKIDIFANSNGGLSSLRFLTNDGTLTERMRIDGAGLVTLASGSGLSIARTAVTAPAAADGNVFSGTYTPTLTNTTNVASSTASVGQYIRVGNVVTVSGQVTIQATAANVDTVLTFSLPIASNLSSSVQLGGTGSSTTPGAYGINNVGIMGDTTADAAIFRLRPNTTSAQAYAFSFTYQVI